jgi:oxygen-dependent protoporphyrinogen oxidase
MRITGQETELIIIGGGMAGLTALHEARRRGVEVRLLEKESEVGGYVKTRSISGERVELGPQSFLKSYQNVNQLAEELGLGDKILANAAGAGHRFLVKNRVVHAMPEGPKALLKTPLLSSKAKFRLFLEPFCLPGPKGAGAEESVHAFGARHLGPEVADTFFDAFVSGICTGDAKKLDVFSLFPRLREMELEHRSLLVSLMKFKKKNEDKAPPQNPTQNLSSTKKTPFLNFSEGMGSLPLQLEKKYSDFIMKDFAVESLELGPDGVWVVTGSEGVFRARKILLATPAHVSAKLCEAVLPELSSALSAIPYPNVLTVTVRFLKLDCRHLLNGFGMLIPRLEKFRLLGALFASSLFPHMHQQPEELATLKLFAGGVHDPQLFEDMNRNESAVIGQLLKELQNLLGIEEGAVEVIDVTRLPRAIPQLNLGHQKILQKIKQQEEKNPSLKVAGNFLTGISVNETIASGKNAIKDWWKDL